MQIQYELPLDADGFLRRECPHCEGEFKWHYGKTDDAPADFNYSDVYYCARCGQPAKSDQWFTNAQLDYVRDQALGPAHDFIAEQLRDAFGGGSGWIKFDVSEGEKPSAPDPLVEPDDMDILQPPCHPWEPVKVPSDFAPPYHCIICGRSFVA